MKYKVIFRYSLNGQEVRIANKEVETVCESVFVDIRNTFCDLVNGQYEKWNQEYDSLGLPYDGGEEGSQYDAFICEKQTKYTDRLNKTLSTTNDISMLFKRFFIDSDCQFKAELTNGIVMDVYLEPTE